MRAANVLTGTDQNCGNWIMTYRDHKPAEAGAAPAATSAPGASSGPPRRPRGACRRGSEDGVTRDRRRDGRQRRASPLGESPYWL